MKLFSAAVLASAVSAGTRNRRANYGGHQQGQSCESARGYWQKPNKIWPEWQYETHSNPSFDKCIFSNILDSGRVGREQMKLAIYFLDQTQDYNVFFQPLLDTWKVLTGKDPVPDWGNEKIDCDFAPVDIRERTEGYINQCEVMCPGLDTRIVDAESAKMAIFQFLDGYRSVINDQFGVKFEDSSDCMYDETDIGLHPLTGIMHDGWLNKWNDPCRHQDRCGQLVRNAYRNIAKFEEILGDDVQIPNLDRSFEKEDRSLHKMDENNRFYDDLYRTGIFGISKFVVESKQSQRQAEWKSRNPEDDRYIA